MGEAVDVAARIRVIDCAGPGSLPIDELLASGQPAVLRGLAGEWGLVQAASRSMHDAMDYLRGYYNGQPVTYSWGGPEVAGRPFYNAGFTDLNCEVRRSDLGQVLDEIAAHADDPRPPTYYVASLLIDSRLPGMRDDNDLGLAAHGIQAAPSIWIGNRVTASCHYDALNNIACCAVGRRRFTLFPPGQISNLYPGPLEPTPGGQAVSVVDFAAPDFERYPRFRDALAAGQSAVLEPGDAIFIPSLWWHHVQGLEPFNVLVNYWWSSAAAYVPTPMHALYHALWTLRDRPEREKQAWRDIFDYYVFGPADRAGEHLPEAARQVLGPVDENLARQLRAMLIGKLNR
ncbi:cupin-like domain-containing protein [Lysobacter sp. S4-A87]|uniref:cupin-like domain-containing protein n=1 Tax=Lysobacter sp. S4-A87 TaxID=2925843 RepID=UPI001F52E313|nr:cupin-like domain-containing protein [Lysobacter sp. S4-A87]UNK49794.1 cupin-like domain-containing protein [Lysobacter sp. S4-A87]